MPLVSFVSACKNKQHLRMETRSPQAGRSRSDRRLRGAAFVDDGAWRAFSRAVASCIMVLVRHRASGCRSMLAKTNIQYVSYATLTSRNIETARGVRAGRK